MLNPAVAADCVVIGCDSMLQVDGELRRKPRSAEAARRQWLSMAGRAGELHTGHCLIRLHDNEIAHHGVDTAITPSPFRRTS
jgi:septum formation protein